MTNDDDAKVATTYLGPMLTRLGPRTAGVSTPLPTQVVIAGAGVAGLETLLALHALAGPRVTTTVLAPDRTFSVRAAAVGTPFGHGSPPQHDVRAIVAATGAHLVHGTLDVVDATSAAPSRGSGERLMYDALVVAVGAQPESAVRGGVDVHRRARLTA